MKINPQQNLAFNGLNTHSAAKRMKELKTFIKTADIKNTDTCKYIAQEAQEIEKLAQQELIKEQKTNKLKGNIDNFLENMFIKFSKTFNPKSPSPKKDLGKAVINAVLMGNIFKDLMTGIVSSTQSFTNPDFSKEKRLFIGSYDVAACLTTITTSFILGPMVVDKIKNGYKKVLKPLKHSNKYDMCLLGLTSISAIVLQSIVAKRMIAPAISTPLAGIMKEKLQEKTKSN